MAAPTNFDPDWDCYPRTTRPIGEDSLREVSHEKDYTVRLVTGDEERMVLSSRRRMYHNKYTREFRFSLPYLYALDAPVNEAGKSSDFSTYGEVSEDFSFVDTQIIYRDLRTDILVYRKWEGNLKFSGNSDHELGELLIDDGIGLQAHTTRDTVGVNANHTVTLNLTEKIVIKTPEKDIELHVSDSSYPVEMNLGVTDYSGYCVGLSYGCLVWGKYGVVDESKPHPDRESYTPLYQTNTGAYPIEYAPPWLEVVPFTETDVADAQRFNDLFGTNQDSRTVAIPLPINADPFPQGSWAVDTGGNLFISQLHSGGVYKILIKADGSETDPVTVLDMAGDNPVYYPIAPT